MKNISTPYTFNACKNMPARNPALNTVRDFRKSTENPYARVFIVTQSYDNLACPGYALQNGTFFNDLYMPYTPNSCCKCGGEQK